MIQVLNRAFDIIDVLSQDRDRAYALSEICQKLGLNAGTCANILKTLVHRDYVEQVGRKQGYRLGPLFYAFANRPSKEAVLAEVATPLLHQFSAEINESVALSVFRNLKRFLLVKVIGEQEIQVNITEDHSPFRTNSGRVLLAYQNDGVLQAVIEKCGLPDASVWSGADTPDALGEMLRQIRDAGLIVNRNAERHMAAIAFPVLREGQCIAALGVYLPLFRLGAAREKEIVKHLGRLADEIILQLVELR